MTSFTLQFSLGFAMSCYVSFKFVYDPGDRNIHDYIPRRNQKKKKKKKKVRVLYVPRSIFLPITLNFINHAFYSVFELKRPK